MAAAAPLAGDRRAVEAARARAQRDLVRRAAAVARLAHERGELDALDRAQRVDDAVRGRVVGAGDVEVVAREPRHREPSAARDLRAPERKAEQPLARERQRLEERREHVRRLHALLEQARREAVRARRRVGVLEAPRVGHEADVERERRALGERDARLVEQARDDLGRARGLGVDEVDVAEERVVVVVVDVDDAREAAGDLAGAVDALRRAAVERDQRALRPHRRARGAAMPSRPRNASSRGNGSSPSW